MSAEDKNVIFFQERKFLNKNLSLPASIIARVEGGFTDSVWNGEEHAKLGSDRLSFIITELSISDCNRRISLDFEIDDTEEDYNDAIEKLDTLIDTIKRMKEAFAVARKRYVEDEAYIKSIKESKKDSK